MIEFNPNETGDLTATPKGVICIVGVGGAGANVLDRIALDQMVDAELINMNSDVRALTNSMASVKIQLGKTITQGLGSGGDPELGMEAARASEQEIRQVFEGRHMVFLCAGLGGGTGSGSAPYVARIAREMGAFVVAFVTQPFSFEGKRRISQAEAALREFRQHANILVVFENDRMGELALADEGIQKAFLAADQIIGQSIRAVTTLVRQPGLIRLGLDDLRTALKNQDARCLFGFGEARGENRAVEALASALKSPLLNQGDLLAKSSNVLVHISGGDSLTLHEIQELMQMVGISMPEHAQILFGAAVDPSLGDRLTVTVITSIAGKPASQPQSPGNGPGGGGGGGGAQHRTPSLAATSHGGGYANPNLVGQQGNYRSVQENEPSEWDHPPYTEGSPEVPEQFVTNEKILPFSPASPALAPSVEAYSRPGAGQTTPPHQQELLPEPEIEDEPDFLFDDEEEDDNFITVPNQDEGSLIASREDGGPYDEDQSFIIDDDVENNELPKVSLNDLVGPPQERRPLPAFNARVVEEHRPAPAPVPTPVPAPHKNTQTAPAPTLPAARPPAVAVAAIEREEEDYHEAAQPPAKPSTATARLTSAMTEAAKAKMGRLRDLITAPSSKLPASLFGDEESAGGEEEENTKPEMNPIARELLTNEQQKELDVDTKSSGHFKGTGRQYGRDGQDLDIPAFLRRKQQGGR